MIPFRHSYFVLSASPFSNRALAPPGDVDVQRSRGDVRLFLPDLRENTFARHHLSTVVDQKAEKLGFFRCESEPSTLSRKLHSNEVRRDLAELNALHAMLRAVLSPEGYQKVIGSVGRTKLCEPRAAAEESSSDAPNMTSPSLERRR